MLVQLDTDMNPIKIIPFSAENPLRIGGSSPDLKIKLEDHLGYFFTIPHPTMKDQVISVFITRNFNEQWDNRGLLVSDHSTINVISHSTTKTRSDNNKSVLSQHSLSIGNTEPDYDDLENVLGHHKLGGYSTLEVAKVLPEQTLSKIKESNFQFWCQIAFPNSDDDDISGDWPVCDCLFSVYYQPVNGKLAAIWERI